MSSELVDLQKHIKLDQAINRLEDIIEEYAVFVSKIESDKNTTNKTVNNPENVSKSLAMMLEESPDRIIRCSEKLEDYLNELQKMLF